MTKEKGLDYTERLKLTGMKTALITAPEKNDRLIKRYILRDY